ncbi:MAG: 5-formyltetrahydrofolate cyclo-ligase [Gammaproteobacteria bacterium]|nr:MAG: 5-formyltetrahydrofolate cyclo-ligase [Gammaproteobacteria bacterium]
MPDDSTPDKLADNVNANQSHTNIRRQKRAQRQRLTLKTQKKHCQALRDNVIKEKTYLNSKHIALYIANDGEIDPQSLIEHAWFLNKKVYLPILAPLRNRLYFAPYDTGSHLRLNRYEIPEPVCHPSQWKTARQLDLLLLPLVAFDVDGNRIGMGGGFYDRTLAYLKHRHHWRKPTLVGLAHDIQKVEQLHTQNWDIPLDCIITEKQRYTAS